MKSIRRNPAKGRPKLPDEKRKAIIVPVKYDSEMYERMMERAARSGMNRSGYIRHASVHCRVVERLKPCDLNAIRVLQGMAENLNRTAKFASALLNGGGADEQIIRTFNDILKCRDFIISLIDTYRNPCDTHDGEDC